MRSISRRFNEYASDSGLTRPFCSTLSAHAVMYRLCRSNPTKVIEASRDYSVKLYLFPIERDSVSDDFQLHIVVLASRSR
jgi:hypothetical protein